MATIQTTDNEINYSAFVEEMVNSFYSYMADIFIEYSQMEVKPTITIDTTSKTKNKATKNKTQPTPVKIIDINNVDDITDIVEQDDNNNMEVKTQSFTDYFLFKLYYNYGVKRRMLNNTNIALLYYDKS